MKSLGFITGSPFKEIILELNIGDIVERELLWDILRHGVLVFANEEHIHNVWKHLDSIIRIIAGKLNVDIYHTDGIDVNLGEGEGEGIDLRRFSELAICNMVEPFIMLSLPAWYRNAIREQFEIYLLGMLRNARKRNYGLVILCPFNRNDVEIIRELRMLAGSFVIINSSKLITFPVSDWRQIGHMPDISFSRG